MKRIKIFDIYRKKDDVVDFFVFYKIVKLNIIIVRNVEMQTPIIIL